MRARTLGLIGAVGAAALIAPAVASAHSVAVTCQNNRAVAQGSAFPVSPAVTTAQLTVDGVARPVVTGLNIPGPNPSYTFGDLIYGPHTLIVSFTNGGPWTSPATQVVCADAPPTPPPPPVVPVQPVPPVPQPVDQVVRIERPIVKKVTRRPKPKRHPLTCAYFKRTHPTLGPAAYAKVGLRYWKCHVPVGRVLIRVPVTG
jgi:hypothetical protein